MQWACWAVRTLVFLTPSQRLLLAQYTILTSHSTGGIALNKVFIDHDQNVDYKVGSVFLNENVYVRYR